MEEPPTRTGPSPVVPRAVANVDPSIDGPLDRATAEALLARADELLGAGDFGLAARFFQRVVGYPEAAVTAAALYGLGEALFRLDEEDAAASAWNQVLELPETPSTYRAWRQIAAMRVRRGDLQGAIRAYREAERRAPPGDRAEIANRLGWLAKETGDPGSARKYWAIGRGAAVPTVTYVIIGVTAIVSVLANFPDWQDRLYPLLQLDKAAVARGEYWRLITDTLLHAPLSVMPLHLLFNLYAIYFAGELVERLYGWRLYLLLYVLTGIAASVSSFVFGSDAPSVGASGAIFGLFGVLLAVSRTHHPMLDQRGQMLLGQIGSLVVLNLVLGFALSGVVDNAAHVGGLVAGLWLGFLLVPGRVPTLASMWQRPAGVPTAQAGLTPVVRWIGVIALVVAIVFGVALGTDRRQGRRGDAPVATSALDVGASQG